MKVVDNNFNKVASSLKTLKESLPMIIEYAKAQAKVSSSFYNQLIEDGVKPEDAVKYTLAFIANKLI